MIDQILIIEPDKLFAARLVQALSQVKPVTVTVAADVIEASLLLSRQKRDLAFIPLVEGVDTVQALRAVQPDLRLALMIASADEEAPAAYAGKVQAVLLKSHLETDLPAVLKQAANQPLVMEAEGKPQTAELPSLETAVILSALQKANLGKLVQTAVFAQKTDLLAHWGELNITQAATIALIVGDKWEPGSGVTLVQFVHLAARAGDLLLYTRPVVDEYLLTLVALPETPLRELRQQSGKLIAGLRQVLRGKTLLEAGAEIAADPADGERKSFAIVWRPVRPIPKSLHIPLRRAIERLATANACRLSHVHVQEQLVHLVVACPPGRDSAWAAYLFKNGSEDTIQREYGVAATLWNTGFYSIESTNPLSRTELNLFLEREYSA